jgi:hypothetical protein
LCRQLKTFESDAARLVMLLFVDEEVEGGAKILSMSDKLCHCVPSCRYSPNHEKRLDLGTFATHFEVSSKGWTVEDFLAKIRKLTSKS